MKITFNDLFFGKNLVELDYCDIKNIQYLKDENTVIIENMDGLYFKSEGNNKEVINAMKQINKVTNK